MQPPREYSSSPFKIYVSSIPTDFNEEALQSLFEEFGSVNEVFISPSNEVGYRWAFVYFDAEDSMNAALEKYSQGNVYNFKVKRAKPKAVKSEYTVLNEDISMMNGNAAANVHYNAPPNCSHCRKLTFHLCAICRKPFCCTECSLNGWQSHVGTCIKVADVVHSDTLRCGRTGELNEVTENPSSLTPTVVNFMKDVVTAKKNFNTQKFAEACNYRALKQITPSNVVTDGYSVDDKSSACGSDQFSKSGYEKDKNSLSRKQFLKPDPMNDSVRDLVRNGPSAMPRYQNNNFNRNENNAYDGRNYQRKDDENSNDGHNQRRDDDGGQKRNSRDDSFSNRRNRESNLSKNNDNWNGQRRNDNRDGDNRSSQRRNNRRDDRNRNGNDKSSRKPFLQKTNENEETSDWDNTTVEEFDKKPPQQNYRQRYTSDVEENGYRSDRNDKRGPKIHPVKSYSAKDTIKGNGISEGKSESKLDRRIKLNQERDNRSNVSQVVSDLALNSVFKGVVTVIENRSTFYMAKLDKMVEVTKQIKNGSSPALEKVEVGMLCLALFDADWYRAKITNVEPLEVIYIDYGNKESCKIEDLRVMPDSLKSMSPLANKMRLEDGDMTSHNINDNDERTILPVAFDPPETWVVQVL